VRRKVRGSFLEGVMWRGTASDFLSQKFIEYVAGAGKRCGVRVMLSIYNS